LDAPQSHSVKLHDIPVAIVLTVGAVSALLLVLIIVLTQCLWLVTEEQQFERLVVERPFEKLEQIESEQLAALHADPTWIDRENGVVQIPIDLAIQRYAEQQQP
jgi:hypothetical protein